MSYAGPDSEKPKASVEPRAVAAPIVAATLPSAIVPGAVAVPTLPSAIVPSAVVAGSEPASDTIHRLDLCNLLSKYQKLIPPKIMTLIPKGNTYLIAGYVEILQEGILIKSIFPSGYCTFGSGAIGIKYLLKAHKNFVRAHEELMLQIDEIDDELDKDISRKIFPFSITDGLSELFDALSKARTELNEEIEKAKKSVVYHIKLASTPDEGVDSYHALNALMKYFVAHEKEQFDLHNKLSFQSRFKLRKGSGVQYNIVYRFFKFLLIAAQNEDNFICERARNFIEDLGGPDSCREVMLQTKLSMECFNKMAYGPASSPSFMAALNKADQIIKMYASGLGSIEFSVSQPEKNKKKLGKP